METYDIKAMLTDGFQYELYANQLWLPRILASGADAERTVFKHILSASKIWIVRFTGESPKEALMVDLTDFALQSLTDQWRECINRYDYSTEFHYTNFRGVPATGIFGDIARHVLNHSTYHRGQLREMFGAKGLDFPETDFLLYAANRPLV